MAIAREEAGTAKMPDSSTGALSGDYVVPQYSEEGRKLTRGAIVGGEQKQSALSNKIGRMFASKGERIDTNKVVTSQPARVPVKVVGKVKAAKQKQAKQAEVPPTPPQFQGEDAGAFEEELPLPTTPAPKSIVVVLNGGFGKIRATVNAVLESETGLCLVFENEDMISYEPEQGGELVLTMPDKREIKVMTMGLKFKWYQTAQQLMTFIKTEKD